MIAARNNKETNSECSSNQALIVTKTNVPLIRAGAGNFFFPFAILLVLFGYFFSKDTGFELIIWLIVIIIFIKTAINYINTVSKIHFFKDKITILKSLFSTSIKTSEIKDVELNYHRLNSTIWITYKLTGKIFPISCNFVVMQKTSVGDFVDTAQFLKDKLKTYEKGIK